MDKINSDVKLAYETIRNKSRIYDVLFSYYKGLQPLKYSTKRLRAAFDQIGVYFAENWIGVIVDSTTDRMSLSGFDISKDDAANKRIDSLWSEYNIELIAADVFEASTITGEGYIVALPSEKEYDDDLPLDIYSNDPRMCHVFYDNTKPALKRMGAKLWKDDDNYICLTLYYRDHFEYYKSNTKAKKDMWLLSAASFVPDSEMPSEPNEQGEIPMFHFSDGKGVKRKDIEPSVISLQDAINMLLSNMMVSAEFSTLKQRVIISQADPGNLENSPNNNWWIPAGDSGGQQSSVQEIGGAELTPYLTGIDRLATAMAIISRTPKHYFFLQGGDPSGEALVSMEAPLNKKVKKKIKRQSPEWKHFARYLLKIDGQHKDIDVSSVSPIWEPVETVLPSSDAQTLLTETQAGVPLITALRQRGWSSEKISQLIDDLKDKLDDRASLEREKAFWDAALSATNAGIPLETFLLKHGWTNKQLEDLGTQKLAAIKLQQEDTIPQVQQ